VYIPRIPYIILYNFTYHSSSHSLIPLNMAYTTSTNFLNSAFSNYVTYNIKSFITLASFSLSLSLKTFYIFSPLIKDTVSLFYFYLRLFILNNLLYLSIFYYYKRNVILILLYLFFYLIRLYYYILVVQKSVNIHCNCSSI